MPKPQTHSKLAALIVGPQRVPPVATVRPEPTVYSEPTVCAEPKKPVKPQGPRPFALKIAQDGHSHFEQAVYDVLWREGSPMGQDRQIAIGYDALAKKARMDWTAARRAVKNLTAKFALDVLAPADCDHKIGTRYRVLSYSAILERRRAAGLLWAIRNRGGVTLCSEPTVDSKHTVDSEPTGTVCPEHSATVCSEHTPLGNVLENSSGKPCPRCNGTQRITWHGKQYPCGCAG